MNCKQGDLARIVPDMPQDEWARGIIVRCVKREECDGPPSWFIDPPLQAPANGKSFGVAYAVQDAILRPIRDPGDDAVDEVLQRVGAPRQAEVV